MSAAVLVIVNSPTSGPRRLRRWLSEAGIEVIEKLGQDGLPETLDGVNGLVMLGGGFMPDDDSRAPWLAQERELAREAILRDLPTLGICLGAQILTHVAGGKVRAKYGPAERGAVIITATAEGRHDAVLGSLAKGAPMIENYQDPMSELPPDAVLLATSDAVAHQAFRLGKHVRAVQFHPEASSQDLRAWDETALADQGLTLTDLITAADNVNEENTAAAADLVRRFAAEVGV